MARLRLAKDLALRGSPLLGPTRPDADAIQGMTLLVQALEISLQVALDVQGITPDGDKFKELVAALPDAAPMRERLGDLYRIRNAAHHRGIPPPQPSRAGLRIVAEAGLRVAFLAAGSDYDRFSSVDQVETPHFKEPLELARSRVEPDPRQAAALVAVAYQRVSGWAAQLTGNALTPDEMWVFATPLWSDVRLVSNCADNRQDFIGAMLNIAGAQALGLSVAELLRLRILTAGHHACLNHGGATFTHADGAEPVTRDQAEWMIEIVARSTVRLEQDWPEFVLVPAEQTTTSAP